MTPGDQADQLSGKGRKSSQPERLINAMTMVCARHGYAPTTIAEVISQAGVSRATFYEYFTDKQDCFLAAHKHHAQRLISAIQHAVKTSDPDRAPHAAMQSLLDFAAEDPPAAQLLISETLAAGSSATERHNLLLTKIQQTVERRMTAAPPDRPVLTIPVGLLIGAVCRLLSPRLLKGESTTTHLLSDLVQWIDSYSVPSTQQIWLPRTLSTTSASVFLPDPPLCPPPQLRPGRRQLSSGEVNRNRRERIIYATAEVCARKSYAVITVDDIVAQAEIARRVFYQHFEDKEQAYLGALDFFFQPLMATSATAFFSTTPWPERIWQIGLASTQFFSAYPSIAYIGLIDSFVVGPAAIRSIDSTQRAFMLFLEEGYRQPTGQQLPRLFSEAITAAVAELASSYVRRGQSKQLPKQLPTFLHLVLTPFIGVAGASQFIDGKIDKPQ
jgi:AcrR family transcriptional regulator